MKCDCKRCDGSGEIVCPDCGGDGGRDVPIQRVVLKTDNPNFYDLSELRKDAIRIMRQAEQLRKLNPERAQTYTEQELACLTEINRQANEVQRRNPE